MPNIYLIESKAITDYIDLATDLRNDHQVYSWAELTPVIYHSPDQEYRYAAGSLANHYPLSPLLEADFLAPWWNLPFRNDHETAACIIGVIATQRARAGIDSDPKLNSLVLADSRLNKEFLRHSPDGTYNLRLKVHKDKPVYEFNILHLPSPSVEA